MIFDSIHKKLFLKEVLGHRYIQLIIQEIRIQYETMIERRKMNKGSELDSLINNLYEVILQLDEDINYQYVDDGKNNPA